ncbi:uncharacterized protein [Musca autumnalis]|uniref:uncharacterized protein n=1 Tax=Musca autumnalis TaxID=221902 RepID=UPI003CF11749
MGDTITWQAPEWLNNSKYLETILENYLHDNSVKIEYIQLKPATANGENYASVMTRIKIYFRQGEEEEDGNLQHLSFIMKCCHTSDPVLEDLMKGYDLYRTEMQMYEEVLPKMSKILQNVESDSEQLFAQTLNVDYEKSTIIFEDLSAKHYIMGNRLQGFNMLHAKFVVEKLAKFHAAAAVLNEQLNGELETYNRGLFNEHTRGLGCMFEYMIEECAKFARTDCDLGEYYHDKLMNIKPHIVDYATKAYSTNNPNHFYTLCHGDLWINNIMLRYSRDNGVHDDDEVGEPILEDILFVDFQFCSWTSPAIDLHYFFNTSLEPQLQMDILGLAELVQLYHKNLSGMLNKLEYKGHIPSLHELRLQIEERHILAVTGILSDQAIATSDQCDDADVHCLVGDSVRARNFRQNCYRNKRHQSIVRHFLPHLDRCGLLDLQEY